jgi:DNA mismatch endonuclease (patch repair protein)
MSLLELSTRSANMRANRRRDTTPEIEVRSRIHARGLRYRCDLRFKVGGILVRPDVVFTKQKVAVFIDGCFWHVCPEHGSRPRVNTTYWEPKLASNLARDERQTRALTEAGWRVIRAWEHESPDAVADLIVRTIRG